MSQTMSEQAIEAAISNLDAIIIRCMEGDRRTNWLPTIARLAEEARAALAKATGTTDTHRDSVSEHRADDK